MSEPTDRAAPMTALGPATALALPSGRELVVEVGAVERLLLRAPSGEVELIIELTPAGPVLKARALRLDLEATESVRLAAPSVSIEAGAQLDLRSGGGASVVAADDVVVLGSMIHLN